MCWTCYMERPAYIHLGLITDSSVTVSFVLSVAFHYIEASASRPRFAICPCGKAICSVTVGHHPETFLSPPLLFFWNSLLWCGWTNSECAKCCSLWNDRCHSDQFLCSLASGCFSGCLLVKFTSLLGHCFLELNYIFPKFAPLAEVCLIIAFKIVSKPDVSRQWHTNLSQIALLITSRTLGWH